jgi:hypothetical protein
MVVRNESSPSKKNCLEWYMAYFVRYCKICNRRMNVHACRFKKAVYAHCEENGCENKNVEICFLDIQIVDNAKSEHKLAYAERQKMIKEIMRAPRMRVPTRMFERNAHVGMGA